MGSLLAIPPDADLSRITRPDVRVKDLRENAGAFLRREFTSAGGLPKDVLPAKLARDGFIRARIDGIVVDLDEAPVLDKKRKHTIEVVVDRFKVKAGMELRLAESFETALNLAGGTAVVMNMENDQDQHLFSSKFACPVCNYSLSELEPRIFSFNNPAGACTACDGLGVTQRVENKRVLRKK